jgi:hypothetical protein
MRAWKSLSAVLVLALALSGCGAQQTEMASDETSADSLLSANPQEQTSGDITPVTDYQEPTPEPEPERTTATPVSKPRTTSRPKPRPAPAPEREPAPTPEPVGITVPAGTSLTLTFDQKVTSETAVAGDSWSGTVKDAIVVGSDAPIPAGAKVHGVVVGAQPAQRGNRAFLVLAVRSVEVDGKSIPVRASTDSIIAGSTRARNLGAIAGGAAAGALLGKAIGGGGKGALIGGLIGGAAATGAVSASKGYQVEMKEGAELTFHTNEAVAIR